MSSGCPLIAPLSGTNGPRFDACPKLFTNTETHTYINEELKRGLTMQPGTWYLDRWDVLMGSLNQGKGSGFKTVENVDEIYNFKVVRQIIEQWAKKNPDKAKAFVKQYSPTSTSSQYQGLIDLCAAPSTTGCGTTHSGKITSCPTVKTTGQDNPGSICYPLYNRSNQNNPLDDTQRQYYLDQVFNTYCTNCSLLKTTDPEYKGCIDTCSCINPELDPTYDEAKKALQKAMRGAALPPRHCWWEPCVNNSQGINNPYLFDSNTDSSADCPNLQICSQDISVDVGSDLMNSGKFNVQAMCPGGYNPPKPKPKQPEPKPTPKPDPKPTPQPDPQPEPESEPESEPDPQPANPPARTAPSAVEPTGEASTGADSQAGTSNVESSQPTAKPQRIEPAAEKSESASNPTSSKSSQTGAIVGASVFIFVVFAAMVAVAIMRMRKAAKGGT